MAFSITEACIGCGACARACPTKAAAGEPKRLHRIEARLCIECGACGRVCPKSAVLDDAGAAVARLMPRSAWARPEFDLSRCISCGACASTCPSRCIAMGEGLPGGLEAWPSLADGDRCVSCGWCAFYCPMACIELRAKAIASPNAAAAGKESA